MVQPFKSRVNTDVFMRFHFFDFFVILMTSGTSRELILDTFGGLETPFWWFLGVLDMHWNFTDFQDLPKLRASTWLRVNCSSRGYSIPSTITRLLTCRTSNSRYLTCWWNIERNWGLSVENPLPPSLVAPGKQGPADICVWPLAENVSVRLHKAKLSSNISGSLHLRWSDLSLWLQT